MAWESNMELLALGIDIGLTALFYKLYKDRCKWVTEIKSAPHYSVIDEKLYEDVAKYGSIPYACVEGAVQPVNNEFLKGKHNEEFGTIRHTVLTEHKTKRQSGYWYDYQKNIKDYIDKIPFNIVNPKDHEKYLKVEQPLEAEYLLDDLKVTHNKYESNDSGLIKRGLDRIFGEVTKGYEEKEKMLTVGTWLLGIGRIANENGRYVIEPPLDGQSYVITRRSKKELISGLGTGTKLLRTLYWFCGTLAVGLTIHYLYCRYMDYIDRRRERAAFDEIRQVTRHRREERPPLEQVEESSTHDPQRSCVICVTNERNVVLLDCGHICLCVDCAEILPMPKKCPICRTKVRRVIATYNS